MNEKLIEFFKDGGVNDIARFAKYLNSGMLKELEGDIPESIATIEWRWNTVYFTLAVTKVTDSGIYTIYFEPTMAILKDILSDDGTISAKYARNMITAIY